jgi:hypothetical protein
MSEPWFRLIYRKADGRLEDGLDDLMLADTFNGIPPVQGDHLIREFKKPQLWISRDFSCCQ